MTTPNPIEYRDQLCDHYERCWSTEGRERFWQTGPVDQLPEGFCILEFAPTRLRDMWTYATCGMSPLTDQPPIELHLFAQRPSMSHVELLTVVAYYHRVGKPLKLGHTFNIGRPWLPGSACEFGLISLPYLDGPKLELFELPLSSLTVRCLWLIPITAAESNFATEVGLEELEQTFEDQSFNYLDPMRRSVV